MGRPRSDDEEEDPSPSKRGARVASDSDASHYDIYLLPSSNFLFPHLGSELDTSPINSAAFLIVNRISALSSSGLLYHLDSEHPQRPITVIQDTTFNIPRSTNHYPTQAVLLGWIEEDQLGLLSELIARVGVPKLLRPPSTIGEGKEVVREWLVGVMQALEMEGVLSNPELLSRGILGLLRA